MLLVAAPVRPLPDVDASEPLLSRTLGFRLCTILCVLGVLVPLTALPASASTDHYDAVLDITFPVDGPVNFTNDYYGSRSRGSHGATDLGRSDAYGLPVHAAMGGTVTFMTGMSSTVPSYGYMIRIAGDDGRDYAYVHLGRQDGPPSEAYAPGMHSGARVERGQHIGFVGHSGNASASWPHLHFEIHDDEVTDPYGDQRRNPFASLQDAEARDDYPGSMQAGAEPGPFDDVGADHPHVEGIRAIVDAEITVGCSQDGAQFCPVKTINRGQMATFLQRTMELPDADERHFDDVSDDHPHARGINAVAQAGIDRGDGQGAFHPERGLERDHMATWLATALDLDTDREPEFEDVDPDSEHAGAIAAITEEGIAQGNGNGLYKPDQEVTRAQMATFLLRAFL